MRCPICESEENACITLTDEEGSANMFDCNNCGLKIVHKDSCIVDDVIFTLAVSRLTKCRNLIAIPSGDNYRHFKVGDKVKLRGDMGGFRMKITKIHNEHFCECQYGKSKRHINMGFLERR